MPKILDETFDDRGKLRRRNKSVVPKASVTYILSPREDLNKLKQITHLYETQDVSSRDANKDILKGLFDDIGIVQKGSTFDSQKSTEYVSGKATKQNWFLPSRKFSEDVESNV
jgi:hypothetical protein